MKITTTDNGYTISNELETMVQRFEYAASVLFPEWEIEHFYYGSKLVMTTLRSSCQYAHFNISANRVSLTGYTLQRSNVSLCEAITHNDECHNGRLLKLVNF